MQSFIIIKKLQVSKLIKIPKRWTNFKKVRKLIKEPKGEQLNHQYPAKNIDKNLHLKKDPIANN